MGWEQKNQAWGHQAASRKQNAKAWQPFLCQCCWVPKALLLLRANIVLHRGSPGLWQGQSGRNLPAPAVTRGARFVLEPCLSHCELRPEAMQVWDGGVSGAPDSSGYAQPSYPSSEGGDFVGGQTKNKASCGMQRRRCRCWGWETRPWSQEIFITILTHHTDHDHKEGIGVVHI